MTRTTNQVSHDLRPMLEAIKELSDSVGTLLPQLYQALSPSDPKLQSHFETCVSAIESLKRCARFTMIYLEEVETEAHREGVTKHY